MTRNTLEKLLFSFALVLNKRALARIRNAYKTCIPRLRSAQSLVSSLIFAPLIPDGTCGPGRLPRDDFVGGAACHSNALDRPNLCLKWRCTVPIAVA